MTLFNSQCHLLTDQRVLVSKYPVIDTVNKTVLGVRAGYKCLISEPV